MKTRAQKWGKTLAVRIPAELASAARLIDGMEVSLSLEDGRIVIGPVNTDASALNTLLRGITDQNRHGEWGTGPATGREAW